MHNTHNPIAVRVENIQKIWNKTRKEKPKAKVFSMVCFKDDFPLLDAFIHLESSAYGKSEDSFVAFVVDFDDKKDFYSTIIEQWIVTFEEDLKKIPIGIGKILPLLKKYFRKLISLVLKV